MDLGEVPSGQRGTAAKSVVAPSLTPECYDTNSGNPRQTIVWAGSFLQEGTLKEQKLLCRDRVFLKTGLANQDAHGRVLAFRNLQ